MSTDEADERIDHVFRNGTLTGVGVLTGFSLTFLCAWGGNSLPWQWIDLVAVAPLAAGIVLQMKALADLLLPDSVVLARYQRLRRIYCAGLILVVAGIASSLALDALKIGDLGFD